MAFKINTQADVAACAGTPAQQKLRAAWDAMIAEYPKGVSSTSTSKYNLIRSLISSLAGIPEADIYATGAATSRTSNLDTRLVQGNQVDRHTRLGLAFIQKAATVPDIRTQANSAETTSKKFLGPGNAKYDAIAIFVEYAGDPLLVRVLQRSETPAAQTLSTHFPHADIVSYADPSPAASPTPAPPTAQSPTPGAPLLELPLNLIYYGPPGCGKTYRVLNDLVPKFQDSAGKRFRFVTFHPSFSYEDFVEGIKPKVEQGKPTYEVVPGIFKSIAKDASANPKPHALFIDEINRGNIPSIFGELISLLEKERRGSTKVQLPYSREEFSVPPNLHVIGTMNTADRSIASIDIALRRRFRFQELRPDIAFLEEHLKNWGVTDATIAGINVPDMLEALNDRLEYLRDREHVIGHSYFLNVRKFSDLVDVFHSQIIPLLQEFFAEDWKGLCHALGENPTESGPTDFLEKTPFDLQEQKRLFGDILEDVEPKIIYAIRPPESWTVEHFKRLAASDVQPLPASP